LDHTKQTEVLQGNPQLTEASRHSYAGTVSVSALFPSPTVTLGISIPASLRNEIITAVPASIIIQLMMNPDYRESVASDFQAGKTPEWYKVRDISYTKDYIEKLS
jgi:hypothetical protein